MTQLDKINNHLISHGQITSITAIGLYGVTRLAAVINKLKAEGATIKTEYKKGVQCNRYAIYSLEA